MMTASATPKVYATLNPLDKYSNVVLSNEDLTLSLAIGFADSNGARATIGKESGVWYYEVTTDNFFQWESVGIGNLDAALRFAFVPTGSNLATVNFLYGSRLGAGSLSNNVEYYSPWISATSSGDTVGIIMDCDNRTIGVINKAGVFTVFNDTPILGTGAVYPLIYGYASSVQTINFGATPFQYFSAAQAVVPSINEGVYL